MSKFLQPTINTNIQLVRDQLVENIKEQLNVYSGKFPAACSIENLYPLTDNTDWTTGFWSGITWLAWQFTSDEHYLNQLKKQIFSFGERLELRHELETHDIGFLYSLSCVNTWRSTGSVDAKKYALEAADLLLKRYHPEAKIIQAWGDLNDPSQQGRMIIDCLMNLPLLYWASEQTGNDVYAEIAENHAKQANRYLVRPDYTTFHTYYMDVVSGLPIKGTTHQGYSDTSCWARGQAWAIYGFALSYGYTGNKDFLTTAIETAKYFVSHLPEDKVCYWDLALKEGDTFKDSSAAAIAICGLLELTKYVSVVDENYSLFLNVALEMMDSLCDNYFIHENSHQGLLQHSVYNMNKKRGVDEYCIWGDYFFVEAVSRLTTPLNKYW